MPWFSICWRMMKLEVPKTSAKPCPPSSVTGPEANLALNGRGRRDELGGNGSVSLLPFGIGGTRRSGPTHRAEIYSDIPATI